MASFKALNIESDEDSDDEIDNTKEIQIEEALKNYQTALKFHSEGPRFFKEAADAYKQLFESEIFKYPESQSEYNRVDAQGDAQDERVTLLPDPDETVIVNDSAPSTLPQILHLSYKNRGEFYLDELKDKLRHAAEPRSVVRGGTSKALADFAEALDKDEADLDLWRRTARVGRASGSERVSRYCLEAVLEGDDEGTDDVLGIPGVEVNFANQELKKFQAVLQDDLSLRQSSYQDRFSALPSIWKKQLKLYPFLPERHMAEQKKQLPNESESNRTPLAVNKASWTTIGLALLERLQLEQSGKVENCFALHLATDSANGLSKSSVPTNTNKSTLYSEPEHLPSVESDNTGDYLLLIKNENQDSSPRNCQPQTAGNRQGDQDQKQDVDEGNISPVKQQPTLTPGRKRSVEAAELPENAEEGRVRSKRLRARQSIAMEAAQAETTASDPTIAFDEKIWENIEADDHIFDRLKSIAGRLGVRLEYDAKSLRDLIRPEPSEGEESMKPLCLAIKDFYDTAQSWTHEKTKLLSKAETKHDNSIEARMSGLASFFENINKSSKPAKDLPVILGVDKFTEFVNQHWLSTTEVALLWLESLLSPSAAFFPTSNGQSAYTSYRWPETLKQTMVTIVLAIDDVLRQYLTRLVLVASCQASSSPGPSVQEQELHAAVEVAQTLFEIHLEHFAQLVGPFSNIDGETRESTRTVLDSWLTIAQDGVNVLKLNPPFNDPGGLLALRHCWAIVFFLQHSHDVNREHSISCINNLREIFSAAGQPKIGLPNSSLMPELSIAAADREMSKIETMDFFLNIFYKDQASPVDLIEALEPILQATTLESYSPDIAIGKPKMPNGSASASESADSNQVQEENRKLRLSTTAVLRNFLNRAHTSLRLSLWKRLLDAYESIDFPPKVISILLKTIGLIVDELKTKEFHDMAKPERHNLILTSLREIGYSLRRIVNITNKNPGIFEFLDVDQLKSSISIISDVFLLLYTISLFDDYSQIGQKGGSNVNPFRNYPQEVFHNASVKFHDMQAQTSLLLYKILSEAMTQSPDEFKDTASEKVFLLRNLHHFLGVRQVCKAADSLLLRFMMDELLSLTALDTLTSNDLAQILYDMYDMNCFPILADRQDHGCDADYLDRKTAFKLIEFVFGKAQEATIKDLLKSDIGRSVEKLNTALGAIKSTSAAARNRKILNEYLKAPLNPLEVWRSMKGIGEVSILPVNPEEVPVAHTGWYFLRAQVALAKHKALRTKSTVQETDDVESAISLLMQDLECRGGRWETWSCLAEAHDSLLEQHVLWSAERLNATRESLSTEQRITIHAYTLALAAMQTDMIPQDSNLAKLAELHVNFGMRIYSSCRPPFSMEPFATAGFPMKHYSSSDQSVGPYTANAFRGLSESEALKTACSLFRRAGRLKYDSWITHYMISKCLWKLLKLSRAYEGSPDVPQATATSVIESIFQALDRSVACLPERKDSNKQDPILEPIFKVAVFAHKLVEEDLITHEEGAKYIEDIMRKQNQFESSKMPAFPNSKDWTTYMIDVLKFLRSVDKSRWHHRLVYRTAKIMYDRGFREDTVAEAAKDAKEYILDQHLYSAKTLALTVWKPDNERPGRHWVYMTRYAKFLTALLNDTSDLESIQLLARRVRKKSNEFFEHTDLWQLICETHVQMHRRHAEIEEDVYESIFGKMDQEEFHLKGAVFDAWIASPDNSNRLVDVLREAAELKKLNQGLWKGISLDNLIVDTYSQIWRAIGPTLDLPMLPSRAATPAPLAPPPTLPPAPPTPPSADRRGIMSLTSMMNSDGAGIPRPSSRDTLQPPIAASISIPSAASELTIRPRSRLISRREVVKRATDSVAVKPQPKKSSPAPEPAANPLPNALVRVLIEAREGDYSSFGVGGTSTAVSSAPASIHDGDADDESEPSVPEEGFEASVSSSRKPMFPNLHRAKSSSPLSETPLDFEDEEMFDMGHITAGKEGESIVENGDFDDANNAQDDEGASGEEHFADAEEEISHT